eukprot:scaffold2731_cov770-Pavlova_lutheri.AAC.2
MKERGVVLILGCSFVVGGYFHGVIAWVETFASYPSTMPKHLGFKKSQRKRYVARVNISKRPKNASPALQ